MHDSPIAGSPLSALITISAPSIQAGLCDEMADAVADIVVDADAVELVFLH